MSARDFCVGLLQETGVMFTPGDCFDMEGYIRIGFANTPEVLREGLALTSGYLANHG